VVIVNLYLMDIYPLMSLSIHTKQINFIVALGVVQLSS